MKVITLIGLMLLCSTGLTLAQSQVKKDDATKKSPAAASVAPAQQHNATSQPSAVKQERDRSEHRAASMRHTAKEKGKGMEKSGNVGEAKSESLKAAMKHGHKDSTGVTHVAHGASASQKSHKPSTK